MMCSDGPDDVLRRSCEDAIPRHGARPQLYLFPFAAVLARKVARPHSAFFLFAAVSVTAAALSFSICGRIGEEGRTAA
ncbi:MAG: hypothetical protein J6Y21_07685, partial [Clostridia bacterium]|nr:hypothetical protein [Clostridia bacterium]